MPAGTGNLWVFTVGEARCLSRRAKSAVEFLVIGDGLSKYAGLVQSENAKPGVQFGLEYVLSEVKKILGLSLKEEMLKDPLSVVLSLQELYGGMRQVLTRDVPDGWFCR